MTLFQNHPIKLSNSGSQVGAVQRRDEAIRLVCASPDTETPESGEVVFPTTRVSIRCGYMKFFMQILLTRRVARFWAACQRSAKVAYITVIESTISRLLKYFPLGVNRLVFESF